MVDEESGGKVCVWGGGPEQKTVEVNLTHITRGNSLSAYPDICIHVWTVFSRRRAHTIFSLHIA